MLKLKLTNSKSQLKKAEKFLPAGVNSPVRAFKSVGGIPPFIKKATGAYIWDLDNNKYIDYVLSYGPLITGHSDPKVIKALKRQSELGFSYGAPTKLEVKMAQTLNKLIPSLEMLRMVNSGTEATMSAIRLARGFTDRKKIVKFDGCYHGHSDALLVKAGSGAATYGIPTSLGVIKEFATNTITLAYNDTDTLKQLFAEQGREIACVIIEPIAGNMNLVPAQKSFLQTLRNLTKANGTLLIFDEVMSGFRVALGGAQELYQIEADLLTFGKIIGAGLPVGAYGGKREIMQHIAPLGGVYQAGTLSGNPLALSAGLALLKQLSANHFYADLEEKTKYLCNGFEKVAKKAKIPFITQAVGAMFGFFFTEKKSIKNYEEAQGCDLERFKKFFNYMLEEGIYFAPSAFEAAFISSKHSYKDLDKTINAAHKSFKKL